MNNEFPTQCEIEIFDAASRQPDAATRRAFLKEVCAQDIAMQSRIAELLKIQTDAEKFFADLNSLQLLRDTNDPIELS